MTPPSRMHDERRRAGWIMQVVRRGLENRVLICSIPDVPFEAGLSYWQDVVRSAPLTVDRCNGIINEGGQVRSASEHGSCMPR